MHCITVDKLMPLAMEASEIIECKSLYRFKKNVCQLVSSELPPTIFWHEEIMNKHICLVLMVKESGVKSTD